MISALPVEPDRDLICVPVGPTRRERGWSVGSEVITINDAVSDYVWDSVALRTYTKQGRAKPIVRLLQDRTAVVTFNSLADVRPENCTRERIRYFDQLTYPTAPYRNTPALARGVNKVSMVRDGRYHRLAIAHEVLPVAPLVEALIPLNAWASDNMPPSLALDPELIQWVTRRNYVDVATEFNARVKGP